MAATISHLMNISTTQYTPLILLSGCPTYIRIARTLLSLYYLQLVLVLLDGNDFHLQVNAQWQFSDGDTGSSWLEVTEVLTVDTVEFGELSLHISQEDVGLHNVLQRGVGSIQNVTDILNHLLSLLSNGGVSRQWLVVWGVRNLARNVDKTYC